MLTTDQVNFLKEMTTNLANESGKDKLVVLELLREHYFSDQVLYLREISAITGIPKSKLRRIEQQALNKLMYPTIKALLDI